MKWNFQNICFCCFIIFYTQSLKLFFFQTLDYDSIVSKYVIMHERAGFASLRVSVIIFLRVDAWLVGSYLIQNQLIVLKHDFFFMHFSFIFYFWCIEICKYNRMFENVTRYSLTKKFTVFLVWWGNVRNALIIVVSYSYKCI